MSMLAQTRACVADIWDSECMRSQNRQAKLESINIVIGGIYFGALALIAPTKREYIRGHQHFSDTALNIGLPSSV